VSARRSGRGRGGKNGAEPTARVRLREIKAMQLHLEGHHQHEIAQALGVSQPAVSKMLRRIEERLLIDLSWRVDRQRARQSLRLEFIYAESVRAWRASQADGLRRRQRKTDGPNRSGSTTVAELVSENRHGDPRFLDEARRALADLRTLWGVDAPERVAVATTNRFASMSDAALQAEVARQTEALERFLPPAVSPKSVTEEK
jgi:hypothetical protein